MKEISILLGLTETATDEDILQAIGDLQHTAKENVEKLEVSTSIVDKLKAENEALVEEKQTAINALAEAENDLTSLKEQLDLHDEENKIKSLTPEDIEHLKELNDKATEVMAINSLALVFMATDGTPFYSRNDADKYAIEKNLKIVAFGDLNTEVK